MKTQDVLESTGGLPGGPEWSALCKMRAQELLQEGEEDDAAHYLCESHASSLKLQALHQAHFYKDENKDDLEIANTCFGGENVKLESVQPLIPEDWVVIQISTSAQWRNPLKTKGNPLKDVYITRITRNDPVTVSFVKRPMRDVETMGLLDELKDILHKNTEVNCHYKGDRRKYWDMRIEHNRRLREVTTTMHAQWIKQHMALFSPFSQKQRKRCQEILEKHKVTASEKEMTVLSCLYASASQISSQCLVAGVHQLLKEAKPEQRKQVALDFIRETENNRVVTQHTVVLILDGGVQLLPWECVPVLESRLVCRMPSVRFLYAALLRRGGKSTEEKQSVYYILNPGNDLPGVQTRMAPHLKERKDWEGIIAREPTQEEFTSALTKKDALVYLGHGSGSRYLPSDRISRLDCKAVPILMGCSSAQLKSLGKELEPLGIPHSYLLAGCRCMVGYLWEVTDVDCDRVSISLIDAWFPKGKAEGEGNLLDAVIKGRKASENFLTGAALVVYGLPPPS